ncbi:hypothetical protein L581_4028 [Serratia fonticola AU-AP2C]|nr:hypothetical protein L581_4028 [Serratia fonticola AU-AP2C]
MAGKSLTSSKDKNDWQEKTQAYLYSPWDPLKLHRKRTALATLASLANRSHGALMLLDDKY